MRGIVEIWRGDELILQEPNMLVDGAGELLADIMSISPSLSGVEDHATSSMLDASNYRINAISFGTGEDAFRSNAHVIFNSVDLGIRTGARRNNHLGGVYGVQVLVPSGIPGGGTRPFMDPVVGLPVSPNPSMDSLEQNTSLSGVLTSAEGVEVSLSSITPGNGQLTNFIPSAVYSATYENTELSDSTSASVAASLMGCFLDGSSAPYSTLQLVDFKDDTGSTFLQAAGYFNEVSSMDSSGFVNMVMSSVPNGGANGLNFSGGASGLCLSAPAEELNEGFPFVEYTVSIASGDCASVHAYGGLYHLGLWTIDMKQSLLNGNTPPFAFSVLNNPRKYKLFCRKALSKDLTYINDVEQYEDLTIKWRIHFR
jgi:hypothetical protein